MNNYSSAAFPSSPTKFVCCGVVAILGDPDISEMGGYLNPQSPTEDMAS